VLGIENKTPPFNQKSTTKDHQGVLNDLRTQEVTKAKGELLERRRAHLNLVGLFFTVKSIF